MSLYEYTVIVLCDKRQVWGRQRLWFLQYAHGREMTSEISQVKNDPHQTAG